MTELAVYPANSHAPELVLADAQTKAVQRLTEWAHSAQAAYQVAEKLVQTSFVPEAFRGQPHEATAAILAGLEVGLSPMSALRAFDVIQGTAAPRAITLRAVAQAAGHQIVMLESTATRCKIKARRRGDHDYQDVVWTIERAQKLGVTNKPNWKNQPQAMLVARATAEAARLVASDAILGLNGGYAVEEIGDEETPESVPETGHKKVTRTAKRATFAPVEPQEPDLDEPEKVQETDEEAEPETVPGGMTKPQSRIMFALFKDVGWTDRDDRLRAASTIVGRELTTSNDLTKNEATRLIDELQKAANADDSEGAMLDLLASIEAGQIKDAEIAGE